MFCLTVHVLLRRVSRKAFHIRHFKEYFRLLNQNTNMYIHNVPKLTKFNSGYLSIFSISSRFKSQKIMIIKFHLLNYVVVVNV